jgi:hypothetical protein
MGIKALQNRLAKMEQRALGESECLMVQLLHDGENTAPATNTAKGVLLVGLSDVGEIPISYVAPTVLEY